MFKWKIIIPAVLVIIVIVVLLSVWSVRKVGENNYNSNVNLAEEAIAPAVNGKVTNMIGATDVFAGEEEKILNEEDADADLINNDKQTVNELGNSYDENEL
jgi:hypothetical protein